MALAAPMGHSAVYHGGVHHHYHGCCHPCKSEHCMHRRLPDHDRNEWREVEPPKCVKPRGLFANMARAVSSRVVVGVATAAMVLTPIIALVVVLVL